MSLAFGKMIPATKWKENQQDLQEGSMVLMKEESMASCDYRLGKMEMVFKDIYSLVRSR